MPNFIDLSGLRFGRLSVIGLGERFSCEPGWICQCDCGGTKTVRGSLLRNGKAKSCGCLRREVTGAKRRSHSMSSTTTFRVWAGMIDRCSRERNSAWKHYGGRGITVCDRWKVFQNFYEDMGECPIGYSIERIDVDSGYSPENCKWIPRNEQPKNTRRTFAYRNSHA